MRLIMAVSRDGLVSRAEGDMSWTGHLDKKLFRLLTTVGNRPLGAGRTTYDLLPELKGRSVVSISRDSTKGCALGAYEAMTSGEGWLIGGQGVALSAIDEGYVHEVFLCHTPGHALEGARADLRLLNFGQTCAEIDFTGGLRVEVRR